MRTYPHITDRLERRILAAALNTWRRIKAEVNFSEINTSKYVFPSETGDGFAIDIVTIDNKTKQIESIQYDKWVGDKVKSFTFAP